MKIRFTRHAREKFSVLRRHRFPVQRKRVIEILQRPERVDTSRLPLLIAQGSLGKAYVLRVVYRKERDIMVVVTFYPGRKSQYEKG